MRQLSVLLCTLFLVLSCNQKKTEPLESHRYTNALVHETSPYLLQHAHNPVNWNPWNTKVLQRAKEEKKLLLISIGYAACHWCHVMEKESFEDSTVAAVMNENFINIKVDREERPDVDQVYINAVQLMTGSAGWPLNVIALPDGRPVWGGTYFQKDAWVDRITQIESLYRTEPEKLEAYASNLQKGIASMDLVTRNDENGAIQTFPLDETMATLKKTFDPEYGGTNRAPKFMMPNALSFLLRLGVQSNDQELIDHVFLTLDKMAYGGLYDAVGGGFSRYSVDNRWHVPHFEKMLYDNALLVSLYSEAYAFSKNPLYKDVVEETLAFIATEMTNDEGAFYSSLDADSDNDKGELEEGAFYTYTEDELRGVLGDDFTLFQAFYNVNDFGYWQEEDAYVLIRKESDASFAENSGLSEADLQKKKKKWRKALQTFREKRARPRLDDKTLTSWNALMLNGYIDAYKTFPNDAYLEVALRNAAFLKKNMLKSDGSLYHSYKNGTSTINGYLEDYASLSKAYIALYEVTLDETWLNLSKELVNFAIAHFQDGDSNMFYFTSDEDAELVTRTIEYRDNVIPASNSIMANNLYKLSHYFEAPEFRELSDQMLKNVLPDAEKYPSSFSNWLSLLLNHRFRHYEVVVSGSDAKDKMRDLQSKYIPNAIFAGAENKSNSYLLEGRFIENQTLIYVCVNNACRLPVSNVEDALANIKITE